VYSDAVVLIRCVCIDRALFTLQLERPRAPTHGRAQANVLAGPYGHSAEISLSNLDHNNTTGCTSNFTLAYWM
jgi:hypothetical protein